MITLAQRTGYSFSDWHAHPDVWLLIVVLVGGYLAALHLAGPRLTDPGKPIATTWQKISYFSGVAVLWVGADWPIHDLSENYLFSFHMVQHTLFMLMAPPLLLMGLPAWLLRAILKPKPLAKAARFFTRPFVGLVLFNVVVVVTHWPPVVEAAVTSETTHLALHTLLVFSALVMWWPVIDPLPEYSRLSEPAKMVYLFLQSIIPTVPASFLTFSSGPIYKIYATFPRLWGLDIVTDQRIAGLIMKIGGGLLLWLAIAIIFFRWNAAEEKGKVDEVSWEDFERELEVWDLRRQ
jgi:putative membrane protein